MLTFEWEPSDEALHIHASPEQLRKLAKLLGILADNTENNGKDHVHLRTSLWGGSELTEEKQSPSASLINHVNIHGWAGS